MWSTILDRNKIVRVCSIYLFIYFIYLFCIWKKKHLFPTLVIISVAGVVQIVFSLSERRLEQANLITKEKLPILKRSQNKPQTINDLQLICHLIAYNNYSLFLVLWFHDWSNKHKVNRTCVPPCLALSHLRVSLKKFFGPSSQSKATSKHNINMNVK